MTKRQQFLAEDIRRMILNHIDGPDLVNAQSVAMWAAISLHELDRDFDMRAFIASTQPTMADPEVTAPYRRRRRRSLLDRPRRILPR